MSTHVPDLPRHHHPGRPSRRSHGAGRLTARSRSATTVVKQGARKIRRLYNDQVLAGFAGSAADSFALFARFESKLEQYRGNLERSAVELAKDWRTDRALRRLEAMLIVADTARCSCCRAPAT